MREETIARIYADALMQAAEEHGKRKLVLEEIDSLAELENVQEEFRLFLESPRVDKSEKKKLLKDLFADKLDPLTLNFLSVLLDKNRQYLLRDIAVEYRRLDDEKEGIEEVLVRSARPVTDEERELYRQRLEKALGAKVRLAVQIDPSLIGGIVIKHEDRILDGSLRKRLEDLRERTSALEIEEGLLYED